MSITPELAPPASLPPGPAPRPRRTGSALGALLLRLHFYAGILVAPFLVVAALTGLLYTITPQLEQVVYARELTVAQAGNAAIPLSRQIAAARASHPEGTITAVRPGERDATTQVDFALPELTDDRQHTVYVDPYTGAVTGRLTTWWGTPPLRTWFDDLHRNLHLGEAGRHYSELAASWLWIIALGGLALWWRRRRSVRAMVAPELSAKKGVRRTRGWHAAVGVWLIAGLLILSATGLTWSRYAGDNFARALETVKGERPYVATTLDGGAGDPAAGGGHHHGGGAAAGSGEVNLGGADTALRAARENGLAGPIEIGVPGDDATAWTVTQIDQLAPTRLDSIAVDPATGTVTDRIDFADWPLTAKLTRWGIAAHMGNLFGSVNQVLLAALAIGLLCVIFWGYRMWWQRRPTRADHRAPAGAPPERGAVRGLPVRLLLIGVPVVAAIGWALPLFGLPLAAFLVVDVIVGAVRRRSRPATPVSPAPAGS